MKVSYRNYPILEKLHKGSLGVMPMFEKDKSFFDMYGQVFTNNWKFSNKSFSEEINVISNTFLNATEKAKDKLMDLWGDICKNDTSDMTVKGTYVTGDFVYMIDYEIKKGVEDQEISMFMFDKQGIPLFMFIESAKYKIYQNIWISSCFANDHKTKEKSSEYAYSKVALIILLKMFKSFADVETKLIKPHSKLKTISCKYVNDTKLELTYLDSKWFTNLVKSKGFNVRGHFRLQPKKKNGQWTKELIWINKFEKTGYTATARKLLQD